MDPRPLGPEHWHQIRDLMVGLFLFVGLALNGAVAFLLAHAVIPSLVPEVDRVGGIRLIRRVLYPVFALSLVLTLYALGRALALAIEVLRYTYPRFLI
jgi:hypothetical protein